MAIHDSARDKMCSPDSVTRQSCDSVGPDLPFGKPARCYRTGRVPQSQLDEPASAQASARLTAYGSGQQSETSLNFRLGLYIRPLRSSIGLVLCDGKITVRRGSDLDFLISRKIVPVIYWYQVTSSVNFSIDQKIEI